MLLLSAFRLAADGQRVTRARAMPSHLEHSVANKTLEIALSACATEASNLLVLRAGELATPFES
jgi:hypothetical protein